MNEIREEINRAFLAESSATSTDFAGSEVAKENEAFDDKVDGFATGALNVVDANSGETGKYPSRAKVSRTSIQAHSEPKSKEGQMTDYQANPKIEFQGNLDAVGDNKTTVGDKDKEDLGAAHGRSGG